MRTSPNFIAPVADDDEADKEAEMSFLAILFILATEVEKEAERENEGD